MGSNQKQAKVQSALKTIQSLNQLNSAPLNKKNVVSNQTSSAKTAVETLQIKNKHLIYKTDKYAVDSILKLSLKEYDSNKQQHILHLDFNANNGQPHADINVSNTDLPSIIKELCSTNINIQLDPHCQKYAINEANPGVRILCQKFIFSIVFLTSILTMMGLLVYSLYNS